MSLLSTAYWAPVSYYQIAAQRGFVWIDQHERYQKQSYRNRCTILSANGPLSLSVPILRPHDCGIRAARIDYSKPWQQVHWRALESAYRSAPFFEEYSAEIYGIYKQEIPFLFDFNLKLWEVSQQILGVSFSWGCTDHVVPLSNRADDYRLQIHPKAKRKPEGLALSPYFQVFAQKFGFVPDVSILDLIFNQGALAT